MGSHGVGVRTGGEEPIGIGGEVNVSGKGTADGLYLYDFSIFRSLDWLGRRKPYRDHGWRSKRIVRLDAPGFQQQN